MTSQVVSPTPTHDQVDDDNKKVPPNLIVVSETM